MFWATDLSGLSRHICISTQTLMAYCTVRLARVTKTSTLNEMSVVYCNPKSVCLVCLCWFLFILPMQLISYRRTVNYWISLILNHHNLTNYRAIGTFYQINKHYRWWVFCPQQIDCSFRVLLWTTGGSSIALNTPVDTLYIAHGDSIITGPTVHCIHWLAYYVC